MKLEEMMKLPHPVAFRHPKWSEGTYYVIRDRTLIEFWSDGIEVVDPPGGKTLGRHAAQILHLFIYWYEYPDWQLMVGFY